MIFWDGAGSDSAREMSGCLYLALGAWSSVLSMAGGLPESVVARLRPVWLFRRADNRLVVQADGSCLVYTDALGCE